MNKKNIVLENRHPGGGKPSVAQVFSKKFSRKATQSPHFKPAALARAIAGVFVCGALAGASGQARCDEPPIEEEYLNDIGATVLLEGGATENAYGKLFKSTL